MAEELWYYEKDGEQHGPVPLAELRALIERGKLSRDNLAWKPGEADWSETGTFEVLVPSFEAREPAPPPLPPPIPPPAGDPPQAPEPVGQGPSETTPVVAAHLQPTLAPTVEIHWNRSPEPPEAAAPVDAQRPGPPSPSADPATAAGTVPERTALAEGPTVQLPAAVTVPPAAPPTGLPPIPSIDSAPPAKPSTDTRRPKPGRRWFQRLAALVAILGRWLARLWSWWSKLSVELRVGLILAFAAPSTLVYYVVVVESPPSKPTIPAPEPEVVQMPGVLVPAGYGGPTGQIKIDADPWAELLRLESSELGVLTVPGLPATPLVLAVPPGSYRVELTDDKSCELEVAEGQVRTCSVTIRTIDAAAYYREVGW